MTTTLYKLLIPITLVWSGLVMANSACDKPKNNFDGLYCLNKVYQEADKELNAHYKKLQGQLDNAGKSALKAGQLTWMEDRNQRCSRLDNNEFLVNLDCATRITVERLQFIQDRSRECASSGCQNSKL
jgi:uncharacterized protein YecT (DUF1311 family)